MYQALYRKYRPESFDEVCGQEVIVKTLINSIKNNMLTHAYLFTGPRGTGKTSIAKILAKTINCSNLQGIIPCNQCVSCTQINSKESLDIIEIDAASNNGVEEIRELKSKVNLVPSVSKYKVYIIDEVHMLTISAFNALLKTLEEPPAHVIFILATTDPHKIPETILSRCQRFDFKRISEKKIFERLNYISQKENIDIEMDALTEISRLSDGGMRNAISMLDQVISYADNKITSKDVHDINGTLTSYDLKKFVENLISNKTVDLLNLIDEYNESGKNLIKLSEEIIVFLKNVLLFKQVPTYFKSKGINDMYYKDLSIKLSIDELCDLIDKFNFSLQDMYNSNNPKFVLELVIIKLCKPAIHTSVVENYADDFNYYGDTIVNVLDTPMYEENIPIHSTYEKPKNIVIDKIYDVKDNMKDIRINNTLAKLNKKEMNFVKESLENLKDLLTNTEYSKFAGMILDGKLKAASVESLVFVFDNERVSESFNENIEIIEEIIEKKLLKHYRVVSTYQSEWDNIRNQFNNGVKFIYKEEKEGN